ncbi:MAG: hypothetical protein IKM95_04340 [Bacteroidales bacterium]|nr:hypothetical protein [Bacteroidales bacterium]
MFFSCHRNQDTLVGRWIVDKVNVDFHENLATPEMVRQFGELEKGNVVEISMDSVLTLIMDGDTVTGRYSMQDGKVIWDGEPFGSVEDGVMKTEVLTPLGWVRTTYKKAGK